jgi:hypothetical protein
VTTLNYSATADLHTLHFTKAHAKPSQSAVSTSRFLVTASNSGDSSTAPAKSSLHRLPYNSDELPNPSRLQHLRTDREKKTPLIVVLQSFPWERVGLQRRCPVTVAYTCLLRMCCLATDVISLFVSGSLPSNGSTCYNINISLY